MTRFELRYRNGIGRGICGVAGDNVDCWMEIQHGKGPWAPPVSGIVPLGSTLTLVVAINDYRGNEGNGESRNEICVFNFWIFFLFSFFRRRSIGSSGEFDMRVKSCVASDGGGHTIQLSDEFGCVLRPKMISRFLKARGSDDRATVITYAFFHAFKFPDALSVHIKCKVNDVGYKYTTDKTAYDQKAKVLLENIMKRGEAF